jgi:hypothetical protein
MGEAFAAILDWLRDFPRPTWEVRLSECKGSLWSPTKSNAVALADLDNRGPCSGEPWDYARVIPGGWLRPSEAARRNLRTAEALP